MKLFKEEKMEDALKLLNQALPIKEKYFGDSHLKVANTKYFIGLIYKMYSIYFLLVLRKKPIDFEKSINLETFFL